MLGKVLRMDNSHQNKGKFNINVSPEMSGV